MGQVVGRIVGYHLIAWVNNTLIVSYSQVHYTAHSLLEHASVGQLWNTERSDVDKLEGALCQFYGRMIDVVAVPTPDIISSSEPMESLLVSCMEPGSGGTAAVVMALGQTALLLSAT